MNEGLEKAAENLYRAAGILAESSNQWMKSAAKAIQTAFEQVKENEKLTNMLTLALLAHIPPYKWVHLSKYAKKSRTRKKYRNRLRRFYGSDDW